MISFGDTPLLGLEPRDQREERMLRLHDPASARDLLTYRELEAEAAARAGGGSADRRVGDPPPESGTYHGRVESQETLITG